MQPTVTNRPRPNRQRTGPVTVVPGRLLQRMASAVTVPVTLVSAPAGYGKTALVEAWTARLPESWPVVHTTLDELGSAETVGDPLLDGCARAGIELRIDTPQAPDRRHLIHSWLAERTALGAEPVIWVVDCGGETLSPALGRQLQDLVLESAGTLALVLLTRSDPPLALSRLRLAGDILEIRAADLAFTAAEASALISRSGCDVAESDVTELHARTAGWPAGLRFAAMVVAGQADPQRALEGFRGDSGNVSAYLLTEVLNAQPPQLRDFMLRTCLPDEIEPGLVAALTSQPCDARTLQFLASGNSFMEEVPGSRDHYRYQPLFQEFLRSQLYFEAPELARDLHKITAEWCAHAGRWLLAVRHAVAAGSWEDAARHFTDGVCFAGLLSGRQRVLWRDTFVDLPPTADGPAAALLRRCLSIGDLDLQACERQLASSLLRSGPGSGGHTRELATAVLDAVAASLLSDIDRGLDAVTTAERILHRATLDAGARAELAVLLTGTRVRLLLQHGDFTSGGTALSRARELSAEPPVGAALAELNGVGALLEALSGRLRRAADLARAAETSPFQGVVDHGTDHGTEMPPAAALALAWVHAEQYDLSAAWELVHSIDPASGFLDANLLDTALAVLRARLLVAEGDLQLAQSELRAAQSNAPHGWLRRRTYLEHAESLIRMGRPDDAISTLQASPEPDEPESALLVERAVIAGGQRPTDTPPVPEGTGGDASVEVMVRGRLIRSEHALAEGDASAGLQHLKQALRMAAPEQMRRPFLEAPEGVRALLDGRTLATHVRWLRPTVGPRRTPLDAPGRHPAAVVGTTDPHLDDALRLVQPLTAKELEVLGHLAELLTTEEIADLMFVSVNTVRSHVRSILRKLGVTRRNEAVRRGWQLALIPPRIAS